MSSSERRCRTAKALSTSSRGSAASRVEGAVLLGRDILVSPATEGEGEIQSVGNVSSSQLIVNGAVCTLGGAPPSEAEVGGCTAICGGAAPLLPGLASCAVDGGVGSATRTGV